MLPADEEKLRLLKHVRREGGLPEPKATGEGQIATEKNEASAPLLKRSSFKDFLKQQEEGMSALSSVGIIGLHMVSGPLVGLAIGYWIDSLFLFHPWGKLVFLFIGILAGFLNVYRDSKLLLARIAKREAKQRVEQASPKDGEQKK